MPQQGLPILAFHEVAERPWRSANGQAERHGVLGGLGTVDRAWAWRNRLGVRPRLRAGDADRARTISRCRVYERTPGRQGYANG